jgi:hypothetical protein
VKKAGKAKDREEIKMQKGKKCKRGKNKIKKAAQWVNFGILLKGGKYNLWRGRGIVSGLIYM